MAIKQKDLKLLWGRSASRCAICRVELSYDSRVVESVVAIGEQAHIVAEELEGPRGQSILSPEERNSYFNLILLCPTHHARVDKAVADYPVEKLHLLKDQHELWVTEQLSSAPTDDSSRLVYAGIVDATAEAARLSVWDSWVGRATAPEHVWEADASVRFFQLYRMTQKALWPGTLPELENAVRSLARVLLASVNVFLEHARYYGDQLHADRFYHNGPPDGFPDRLGEFEAWSRSCDELLREATRAANWCADVVRRELNPSFFLFEGRFGIVEGPYSDLSYRSNVYEYTSGEREQIPALLEQRLQKIVAPYTEAKKKDQKPVT